MVSKLSVTEVLLQNCQLDVLCHVVFRLFLVDFDPALPLTVVVGDKIACSTP